MESIGAARRAALLAAAFILALGAGPARAADPFFPAFGNTGYDVADYALSFDVDPSRNRIGARAVLTARALATLQQLSLDLAGLRVSAVTVDGVTAGFRQRAGKLVVRPVAPIPQGARFSLAVTYGGTPSTLPDPTAANPATVPGLGWSRWRRTSYVVSEPVGAGTWYPANDVPTDKATYLVTVTVPEPYQAVANGVPVSVTDLGQRRRYVWRQAQPMASYLAILDIDSFRLETLRSPSGVTIRNYLTDDTPAASRRALGTTPEMVAFIESLVGPYPFDGYGAVMVRDPGLAYALETQAMSTFQKDNVDELTVMHELAHQWFGNAVTVKAWRDLWLAEGFATYFEYLWRHRGDRAGLNAAMRDLHRYVAANRVGPAVVSRPQDIFADNTYYRGALTLHALRLEVGDTRFFQILRRFYGTYRNANASSADFIAVAVEAGGSPSVRPLLRAWLYNRAVPSLAGADGLRTGAGGPAKAPALGIGVRRRPPTVRAGGAP